MKPYDFLQWMHSVEKIKCRFRHSKTSCGRDESVAEHSYRLIVMAYVLKDTLVGVDSDKIIKMCIIHDLAEAVTGDIPSFLKTDKDENIEKEQFMKMIEALPRKVRSEMQELYLEMEKMESKEAIAFKALDKMEAVIQHNEADISTWLDMEYELQKTYGIKEADSEQFLKQLRQCVLDETEQKIAKEKSK